MLLFEIWYLCYVGVPKLNLICESNISNQKIKTPFVSLVNTMCPIKQLDQLLSITSDNSDKKVFKLLQARSDSYQNM